MQATGVSLARMFLDVHTKTDDHLEKRVKVLLEKMNETSNRANIATGILRKILEVSLKDEKLDFSNDPNLSAGIDTLYKEGVLKGKQKYIFEKKEIETFKFDIESYKEDCLRKNQEPTLLLQPILHLIKQLADIVLESIKDEAQANKDTLGRIR